MTKVSSVCEKCGAEIVAGAPAGVCTACLFEAGLDLLADGFVAGIARPGRAGSGQAVRPARQVQLAAPRTRMYGNFGDYELLEEIGRGGQGVVYRAKQKSLNRTVALKIVGSGHWATEAHLRRFRLEAKSAASLNHPCIVPIYEIGERDGSCYFSMGLVDGGQLDKVAMQEALPPRRAAELIAKLARTINYAHEHGILHRDIKPGNILLDAEGEPHLTDFGLARLAKMESDITRTTDLLGTPSYMAPEQARWKPENAELTSTVDVYGLGGVLYYLLTARPPFAGETTYETLRLLLETEPRQPRLLNPKVDSDLNTICLKCLEKDPNRRYSSALALSEDLERWLKSEPIKARKSGVFTHVRKWVRRSPAVAAVVALSVALTGAIGWNVWRSQLVRYPETTGIAVLPFENLSDDKDDTFFADGVQDDLLTKLAKIADLKVISRTSLMQYRGRQNVPEIGKALRVSHVLEGSVRKMGDRVYLNAQLIDTRTDAHLWAEQYDRDLKDLFVIQSDIARKVANQLHAKISDAEKRAIADSPTADLTAFNLYSRAKNLLLAATFTGTMKANLLQAVDLLNLAVARDPGFLQAYCQLAWAQDQLYWFGFDHTAARLALAEAAIQAASRLYPDAGETHLARAQNLYRGYLDYDGALFELERARPTLPNDPRIFQLAGYIQRRQGRWEESTRNLERAVELDPRNLYSLQQIAVTYGYLRRYSEQKSAYDRALAIEPDNIETKVLRAYVQMDERGDMRPLHQIINLGRAVNPVEIPSIVDSWLVCALAERDNISAKAALLARGANPVALADDNVPFCHPFIEGVIARMIGSHEKAGLAFSVARTEQEKAVLAQPNYAPALCVLGLIDAALGHNEEALREGRRAVELLPVTKDAINGSAMIKYLAMIAAWTGDKNLACQQLAIAIHYPGPISYGQLKLMPFWDPLRNDPRFEEIVNSLAPKSN